MTTPEPRARTTDPATSYAVASAQTTQKLRVSHRRVLAMFRLYGDMHDKALLDTLNQHEREVSMKLTSPSGARSRRSELAQPNDQRMAALRAQFYEAHGLTGHGLVGLAAASPAALPPRLFAEFERHLPDATLRAADEWARRTLRAEGFRSWLWDTGRREVVDGHRTIVWGIAK